MKKFDYTPILGWSVSRYDLFQTCKRKYYFNYYSRYSPDYEKIIVLKNLSSIPLSIGVIVHDIIRDILNRLIKSEEKIDRERLKKYIAKCVETYTAENTFEEIYYNKYNEIHFENIYDEVINRIFYFLDSDSYTSILQLALPEKKRWIIEPPGYGETRINNLKAYCKVDFLFPVENRIYILDWKTGKPHTDKHQKQLLGYACWASFHYNTTADKIIPKIVYLNENPNELLCEVTTNSINRFTDRIKQETTKMYEFCHDVEQNIPKPVDEFNRTESIILCNYCNYKEICL